MYARKRSGLRRLARGKIDFSYVLLFCTAFFLVGFFGSSLVSNESYDGRDEREMPHGVTGDPNSSLIPFQILSWKPRLLYFPEFATEEQCKSVIGIARWSLEPSSIFLLKGETAESTRGLRTSSGTFIRASEDSTGVLGQIEEKIAKVTMIPRDHGESFNILRYEIGQKYDSHYDAFHTEQYGPQKSNRMATFLLYLSDVEEGGETMFPYENGLNMDVAYDYQKCIGLRVKPKKGDGLLFHSILANGTIDETSFHGSCPVIKGEKWVATKWIRNQISLDL